MKTFITLMLIVAGLTLRASDPPAPADVKALQATIQEQQARIERLFGWVQDLERRMKLVEQLPEIRVPRGIRKNLRILMAALDQYCSDHHVRSCTFEDLVGKDKFVKPETIPTYDKENYRALRYSMDESEWRVDTEFGYSIVQPLPKLWRENKK